MKLAPQNLISASMRASATAIATTIIAGGFWRIQINGGANNVCCLDLSGGNAGHCTWTNPFTPFPAGPMVLEQDPATGSYRLNRTGDDEGSLSPGYSEIFSIDNIRSDGSGFSGTDGHSIPYTATSATSATCP